MDRGDTYRAIVKRTLQGVADITPSEETIRTEFVCDDSIGHYEVSQVGWEGKHRVDDVFLHVDVLNDMVWLQHDGTNLKIAEQLVKAGIPKDNIVLAFHHPNRRPHTDYGVA